MFCRASASHLLHAHLDISLDAWKLEGGVTHLRPGMNPGQTFCRVAKTLVSCQPELQAISAAQAWSRLPRGLSVHYFHNRDILAPTEVQIKR